MELKPEAVVWEGTVDLLPEFKLERSKMALLIIDMQYLDAHPDFGIGRRAKENKTFHKFVYYFDAVREIIPRIQAMQKVSRERGIEVIFVRIASYVKDCRDVSLAHKRLNLLAPAGSKEAQVLEELAPLENEIVLNKGCSGVFNGTAIDQILRNMGIETLIVCGVVTDGCVETAVRDASDRGYNVILLSDACATSSPEDHAHALRILNNSSCKLKTTQEMINLIVSDSETTKAMAKSI